MNEQVKNENEIVSNMGPEKEKLMTIGEQRYEAIGKGFKRFGGMLSSWKEKAGSFLKTGAKKTVIGALATPDAIGRVSVAAGKGAVEGTVAGLNYADKKLEQFGNAVDANVIKPTEEWTRKAVTDTKEWTKQAKIDTVEYLADKGELAKEVAIFAAGMTAEGVKDLGKTINKNYNKLIEHGENAYKSVVERKNVAKRNFFTKFHTFMKNRYEAKALKNNEKWMAYSKKLAQYKIVESLAA